MTLTSFNNLLYVMFAYTHLIALSHLCNYSLMYVSLFKNETLRTG